MKKIIILLSCLCVLGFVAGCCSTICPTTYKPIPCAQIEQPEQPIPMDMMKVDVTDKKTGKTMTLYGFHEKDFQKFIYNIEYLTRYNQRCYKLIKESVK